MSFQPVVPLSGYTGWLFLQRTLDQQQAAFQESATVTRATSYFRENVGEIDKAEDLVADRQLLNVALGAFGLDEDINSKFFIQKILDDGTTADDALANRLADTRYRNLSEAFGFGDFGVPLTSQPLFAEDIIDRFQARQFERAVGEVNNDMRLALNVKEGISDIVESVQSDDARWFSLLGNQPLRQVIQTALGLPTAIATLELDKQLETFKERAQSTFGTDDVAALNDPELQEKMIRLFLVRSENQSDTTFSSGSVALTLLQS